MCPLHARWLPLARFLCSLVLFRGPPFASSSASVFCWRGFFLDSPTSVALLAGSLRSASPVLFSVSGLSALVPVVQVCLRAARLFCLVAGSLSAGFVWGSGFPVLLFILLGPDLTLSAFLAPASRPWGFTGWGLCLSWLLSWLGLSLAISWWPTYWYPCVSFRFSSGRSFPPSWWGPALLLHWTSFQSVLLVYPGHSLLFLALSSSFCQVLVHCLLSSLWLGWCSASFPAACTRSLYLWPVGCSPVSSVTVRSCVLSWSLGFSIPGQFPRPGLLFPGSRILQLPPPWYSRWHLDPAFCSSGVLHPTLTSGLLFLFLVTAFPTVQLVPRFSLLLF